jgi:hypothetical protein
MACEHAGQSTMINDPGKRLAAGLWKVLAGIALVLLLLTQQAQQPDPDGTEEVHRGMENVEEQP